MSIQPFWPISPIYNFASATVRAVGNATAATARWAGRHLVNLWNQRLVPDEAKSFVATYISPLNLWDGVIMTASGALALAVYLVVMPILGNAFFAFGVISCAAILLCGVSLVRYHSSLKLSEKAVREVQRLLVLVRACNYDDSLEDRRVNEMQTVMGLLTTKEFENDRKNIDQLRKEFIRFKKVANNKDKDEEEFNSEKGIFITYLEGFRKQLVFYFRDDHPNMQP